MGDCISAPSTMIPFSLGLDLPKGKIKGTRNVQSQKEIGPDVSYTYIHDHTTMILFCCSTNFLILSFGGDLTVKMKITCG